MGKGINKERLKKDYLKILLRAYYPIHFFSLFRAHELYNVEPFINLLSPPVLDLGCGDGIIADTLFGRQLDYGIDVMKSAVEKAKKRGVYKRIFLGDAVPLPLEDDSLGGIFSNCVLEHISNISGLVSEISRVLRPGCYLIATCISPFYYDLNPLFNLFNRPSLQWIRGKMIREEDKLHHHVSIMGIDGYRRLFEENGMLLETYRYYAPESITKFCNKWDSLSKYILPFPKFLTHRGLLIWYLLVKYSYFSDKKDAIQKWYEEFFSLCYSRNAPDQIGAGQILIARKI